MNILLHIFVATGATVALHGLVRLIVFAVLVKRKVETPSEFYTMVTCAEIGVGVILILSALHLI